MLAHNPRRELLKYDRSDTSKQSRFAAQGICSPRRARRTRRRNKIPFHKPFVPFVVNLPFHLLTLSAPSAVKNSSLSKLETGNSKLYFKSRITIHDAIAGGLPLDPDELRRGLGDDEAWSQEYLCEFAVTLFGIARSVR